MQNISRQTYTERDHLGDLGVDGWIGLLLKRIIKNRVQGRELN